MEKRSDLYGVILAGGSGSRLWPLSREMHPKQLLKLAKDNTLFQSTVLRLERVVSADNIISVTNIKHSEAIKLQLNELSSNNCLPDKKVVIEPVGRNTAPAIGLATFYILKEMADKNTDPIIIVAPSDHLIKKEDIFTDALNEGIKLAESGYIVTFGIKPDKPDTGYGYVSTLKEDSIENIALQGLKVQEFKEKPDFDTAEMYVKSGTYFWNSGIFMFKASTMITELNKYCPKIMAILENSKMESVGPTININNYETMPNISIDYAVMEESKLITLIPMECGWNDMGSWEALFDIEDKDVKNNFISGNVVDIDSENSLIYSTSKLVTTIGLKDTVVVETEDAILVCDKNKTQDVKKIFEKLKENNDHACIAHNTVCRPWGHYTILNRGEGFLAKVIQVNPKAKLSLQMHHKRKEHWVVVAGIANVRKGDQEIILNIGDSVDIPVAIKHSIENSGVIPLKIIEVQYGDFLEEDDIVRFEDIYGRVSK